LRYPSDLTDDEWGLVEPLIPPGKTGGGKRTVIMREVVNGLAKALDRRAHHCLAQSLPKACQGLGESQPKGARVLAPCLNTPHAQKTMQSDLKSPDGL
jgi:hypothetical protein